MSASQPANLVRVVRTSGLCILRQLRLEEKLLRSPGAGNWCLLNDGTPDRAVVLGISGKADEMLDVEAVRAAALAQRPLHTLRHTAQVPRATAERAQRAERRAKRPRQALRGGGPG